MGGFGTFKLADAVPRPVRARRSRPSARPASACGPPATRARRRAVQHFRQLASLRHIPFLIWNAAGDQLVPYAGPRAQAGEFDRLGYRYEFDTFAPAEHLTGPSAPPSARPSGRRLRVRFARRPRAGDRRRVPQLARAPRARQPPRRALREAHALVHVERARRAPGSTPCGCAAAATRASFVLARRGGRFHRRRASARRPRCGTLRSVPPRAAGLRRHARRKLAVDLPARPRAHRARDRAARQRASCGASRRARGARGGTYRVAIAPRALRRGTYRVPAHADAAAARRRSGSRSARSGSEPPRPAAPRRTRNTPPDGQRRARSATPSGHSGSARAAAAARRAARGGRRGADQAGGRERPPAAPRRFADQRGLRRRASSRSQAPSSARTARRRLGHRRHLDRASPRARRRCRPSIRTL